MRKMKNYFKTGILLLGIPLLLLNCENDDSKTIESVIDNNLKIEIISLKQIENNPLASIKLKKIIAKTPSNFNTNSAKNIYNAQYDFTINTEYVKYIKKGDYDSYNFPLTRNNPTDDKIENLLLTLNKAGDYDSYIVKYNINKEQLSPFNEENINEVLIQYIPINVDSSSILAAKFSYDCFTTYGVHCDVSNRTFEPECVLYIISTQCVISSGETNGETLTSNGTGTNGTTETSGGTSGSSSTNNTENLENPIISTPTFDDSVEGCTGGKIKNFKNICVCPEGYIEDTDGNCVKIYVDFNIEKLTQQQKETFENAKSELEENCLGKVLFNNVERVNIEMGATLGAGEYNSITNTIKFRSINDLDSNVLGAELFHAYQQQIYGTLDDIENGTKVTGGSNIEFEEKAFNIKKDLIDGNAIFIWPAEDDLIWWLQDMEEKYESSSIVLTQEDKNSWFNALEKFQNFHKDKGDHYGDPIDYNLLPNAIINLINKFLKSNCN